MYITKKVFKMAFAEVENTTGTFSFTVTCRFICDTLSTLSEAKDIRLVWSRLTAS